ncbi:MAG: BMP family ABC transporter substrate-binding protein [Oscillospiraceae bacterium]|nr:BMP family ABC transporter substrate-binding protein [Oscillospiraceae bacterium]MBR3001582.1 BMP family ABC transporter substrate-binding protein [Oscillospiraceae bacterium]
MKKFLSMLLVLVLAFALVACGSAPAEENTAPESEGTETTPEPEDKVSVCFITEALGDNSFADASDRSLKEYVDTYGIEYFCTQVGAGGDQITATREAAQNGYDIVAVGYSADVLAMVQAEAKDYPNTLFYLFSAKADTEVEGLDNVVAGFFRSCESSYVGGLVAGAMSETGKCAFVGGQENVGLYDWMIGYVQGVERAGSISVYSWINGENPWSDPAKAKELSRSLKNNYDADMFWGCAGQSGDGVFQAVIEFREENPDQTLWALGVDADQYAVFEANDKEDVAEVILTSCMKNPVGPVAGFIETLQAGGKIQGGKITCGIKDGACGIAENDWYRAQASAEAQQLVETAKNEIKNDQAEIVTAYGLSIEDLNAFLEAHTLNYQAANM